MYSPMVFSYQLISISTPQHFYGRKVRVQCHDLQDIISDLGYTLHQKFQVPIFKVYFCLLAFMNYIFGSIWILMYYFFWILTGQRDQNGTGRTRTIAKTVQIWYDAPMCRSLIQLARIGRHLFRPGSSDSLHWSGTNRSRSQFNMHGNVFLDAKYPWSKYGRWLRCKYPLFIKNTHKWGVFGTVQKLNNVFSYVK